MHYFAVMNLDAYHCSVNPTTGLYEFYSEGPNGKVKKVIDYQHIGNDDNDVKGFNLCFGDWDENVQDVCDLRVTNNSDRKKVLATVAKTVMFFTEEKPDAIIYGVGSTPARTRLYQMSINSHWEEVNRFFTVRGKINDNWELFRRNKNYEGLLVTRKSIF